MAPPRADMKMNAIRSGIVVLGALAFGYLSIQIGFKPYLEKAQHQNALLQSDSEPEQPSSSPSQESFSFQNEVHRMRLSLPQLDFGNQTTLIGKPLV